MIGHSVGPYRVLERLGSGGMGDVYLAEDPRLDRKVALKRPSDAWLAAPDARQRLLREARAAARLSHPHIAAVHDVLDVDGRPYIVMEYVAGETLSACLRHGRLPIDRAVEIGLEIAEAVAEAHAHGVLHRDLKPGNIALTLDGRVKVLDFGLARLGRVGPNAAERPSDASLATPGAFLGTPGYAAPEQLAGGAVDERADVFAIGAILFEAITGRPAFSGPDSLAVAMATVSTTVPRVASLNPAAPLELDALVARALDKTPGGRYPSALEVAAALKRVRATLGDRPTDAASAAVAQPAPAPPPARGRTWWRRAITIAGSAAVLAAVAWGWLQLGDRGTPLGAAAPVVAVLPFEVTGDGLETAALAAGLADTLTLDLSALKSLVVVPRKETLALGGADGPARAAREQGATYVVRGTVSQAGAALQLDMSLIRPADGRAIWRQSYQGAAATAIVLEQRARQDLAFALRGSLSDETFAPIGTSDAQAFAYYSQGRSFLDRWDVPGNLDHAITLLRAAVGRDQDYAVAHASLGEAYWTRVPRRRRIRSGRRRRAMRRSTRWPSTPTSRRSGTPWP